MTPCDPTTPSTYMTQRAAARSLYGSRSSACRALEGGLAGPAIPQGRRRLYGSREVDALADRPGVDLSEVRAAGIRGFIGIRVPRTVRAAVLHDPERLAHWASGPWQPTACLRLMLEIHLPALPTVVTLESYVLAAYDTANIARSPEGIRLQLAPPGAWAGSVVDRQWDLGRGTRTFRYLYLGHYTRWFA